MKRYDISFSVLILLVLFLYSAILISSSQLNNVNNVNGNIFLHSSSNREMSRILDDTLVNNYTGGYQFFPDICALTDEIFVITWNGYGESDDNGVYARVFNATSGNNITSEFRVNNHTTGSQIYPSICALSNETFAIAWHGNGTSDDAGIYARVFNATSGNNISSEILVNNYTTNNQQHASICALSNEKFAVAWYGVGESDYGTYARVFNATSGNNITSEFRVNNYTTGTQIYPSICALSNDIIAVAWEGEGESDNNGVYVRIFNATTSENLTSEFRVNDQTVDGQEAPSICALSNKTLAITWTSINQDGSDHGIYARIINMTTGIVLSQEFRVNHYILGRQTKPSICALSRNVFAISWESSAQDGSEYGIYTTIINITSGIKMSSEYCANQYTMGSQQNPSICALSDEKFAITWNGEGLSDAYGIYVSILAIVNTSSTPDGPAFNFILYLLVFIIIIGITLPIVAGRIYSVKKKKYASGNTSIQMTSKIKNKRRSYLDQKPVNTTNTAQHKKIKKSALPTSKVGLTEIEKEELKLTESEVNVEKPKVVCVVHKGPIQGNIYMCPECNTFYCVNCARILKLRGEKCWVCDSVINIG